MPSWWRSLSSGDRLSWTDKYLLKGRSMAKEKKGRTFHTAVFSLRVCHEISRKALIRGLINLLTEKIK
jgi:hypothetical protein